MQKLLSIFVYLILLIFLESAAEVTGVPASAPAELPEEPNYVALTFDDGPRRGTTTRLLDGLRERGANATFFLVGERLAGNEDLVLRMQAEVRAVTAKDSILEPYPPGRYGPSGTAPGHSGSAKRSLQTPGHG